MENKEQAPDSHPHPRLSAAFPLQVLTPTAAPTSTPSSSLSGMNDFQIWEGEPSYTHLMSWVIYESNCAPSGLLQPEIDVVEAEVQEPASDTVIFIRNWPASCRTGQDY